MVLAATLIAEVDDVILTEPLFRLMIDEDVSFSFWHKASVLSALFLTLLKSHQNLWSLTTNASAIN